jgi:hypothetical protein
MQNPRGDCHVFARMQMEILRRSGAAPPPNKVQLKYLPGVCANQMHRPTEEPWGPSIQIDVVLSWYRPEDTI